MPAHFDTGGSKAVAQTMLSAILTCHYDKYWLVDLLTNRKADY